MQAMKKHQALGPLFLRYGLALSLLWSVLTKLTKPEMVAGLFEALGLGFVSETMVTILAIGLLIAAVLLVLGKYLHEVGIVLSVFFIVAIVSGGLAGDAAFSVGPGIWKDFALLGLAMYFAVTGDDAK